MPLGNAGKLSSLGREKGILSFFFSWGRNGEALPWFSSMVTSDCRYRA